MERLGPLLAATIWNRFRRSQKRVPLPRRARFSGPTLLFRMCRKSSGEGSAFGAKAKATPASGTVLGVYDNAVIGQPQLAELGRWRDLRLAPFRNRCSFFDSFEEGATMQWRFCARSAAIGAIFLTVALATAVVVEPARAQAQQLGGFNEFDSRWALASGLNADSSFAPGSNRQAYTAALGPGTVGLFVESSGRDAGAGASGISGNAFSPLLAFPTSQRQDWFANLANPDWRTSIGGIYRSAPATALFSGVYTTASFGMAGVRTNPLAFSGLPNYSAGNDAVALTARAGLGVQLTPQISVEGSFSWTQMPASTFR
jgi:hypothetical protein